MAKNTTQTLKGFRDTLPEEMIIRREAIKRLESVFEKFGFDELETPALEYKQTLVGKYGEEAERLIYLFQDAGGREIGLRYDLTVPLARLVGTYPDLPKPFKRYQIQPVWRAEKPQKGRYREFYQCDFDIVGSASPMADAEIIATMNEAFTALGFTDFKITINSRKVLEKCMKVAKVPKNLQLTIIQSIDKLARKSKADVKKEFVQKGLSESQTKAVFSQLDTAKPDEFLLKVIEYSNEFGVGNNLEFTPTLARGLDYYTGPIFECSVKEPNIGSVSGGGRYDKLIKNMGGPDLTATGASIGLDRVFDVISEKNLWKDNQKTKSKVLVTVFSDKQLSSSIEVVNLLRKSGINSELYLDGSVKLEKQLKYADKKNIPWVVIIGPDEILKGRVVLKNLKTKTQEKIPTPALLTKIQ